MIVKEKKSKLGMLNQVDRLSDLPELLMHHIISFLGTKEACRTSTLSKRWRDIWATSPVLDFQLDYFLNKENNFQPDRRLDNAANEKYIGFIETTMQKYSVKRLSIRKLTLKVRIFKHGLTSKIDKWLKTAVENQVEDLSVSIIFPNSVSYRLPTILFFAKSLKCLSCFGVKIPYYETTKFGSIRHLSLYYVRIKERMLQHIINSCPLDRLSLKNCSGIKSILIPYFSKLKSLEVMRAPEPGGMINVESSSLVHLTYDNRSNGWIKELVWPWKIDVELRNLRTLSLCNTTITDEIFVKLISGLVVLEELSLDECDMLENIHVYGSRMKQLHLYYCGNLTRVTVDTPNLDELSYNGHELITLIATNIPIQCKVYARVIGEVFNTDWFIRLKKFLVEPSICRVLEVEMASEVFEFDEDEATSISPITPYKLSELRISLPLKVPDSSLLDFVDGLLWSCHPDHLAIPLVLDARSAIVGSFIKRLMRRVNSQSHPLRGIEVAGIDSTNLLDDTFPEMVFRFKLRW